MRLLAAGILLLAMTPAFAQERELTSDDVEKIVKEAFTTAESQTAEVEGVLKLTYKGIVSGPDDCAKRVGQYYRQINEGKRINIAEDVAIAKYREQSCAAWNKLVAEGTGFSFEALVELDFKGKKVPKGEYRVLLGMEQDQLRSVTFVSTENDKKKRTTVVIALPAAQKNAELFPKLRFSFTEVKDKKTEKVIGYALEAEFGKVLSKSKDPLKGVAEKSKDEPKKDAPDEK
jgi:hypothetical protein